MPWAAEPTAQVIHDSFYHDGRPVTMAPRYVLRHILDLYAQKGWKPIVAPELEFYLVEPNIDADYPLKPPVGRSGRPEIGRQSYSIAAVNEFDPLFDDIYAFCEAQEIEIDTLIHEDGAAQMEINLIHGDAMSLADQVFMFKRTAREAAFRHKMYATFMSKPMAREPGSAMHIHQSIVDIEDRQEHLQRQGRQSEPLFFSHIAGLQKYLPSAMCLFAPNVNSFRRITAAHGPDQHAVGLRQSNGWPPGADFERRESSRREPPRRSGRKSVPRARRVARLRLSRHDRGPEAVGARRRAARTTCRSACRAASRNRCACCAIAGR